MLGHGFVTEMGVDLSDDECPSVVAIGWVPTLEDTPLASSALIAEPLVSPTQMTADGPIFWGAETVPADLYGEVRVSSVAAAVPKCLGSFPFWRGSEPLLEAMQVIYAQASPRGLDLFLGERSGAEAQLSLSVAAPQHPLRRRGLPRRRL